MKPEFVPGGRPGVVAIGQVYGGDDGIGLAVAARLEEDGYRVDIASDASLLVELLERPRKVILIDALAGAVTPGELRVLRADDVAPTPRAVSSHAMSVADAISLAKILYGEEATERVFLVGIGIVPPNAFSEGLSPEVARAVEPAVRAVKALLSD